MTSVLFPSHLFRFHCQLFYHQTVLIEAEPYSLTGIFSEVWKENPVDRSTKL